MKKFLVTCRWLDLSGYRTERFIAEAKSRAAVKVAKGYKILKIEEV